MSLATVQAAPPPGHPGVDRGADLLGLPAAKPGARLHTGRVLASIDSNNYTYILVGTPREHHWLAAPRVTLRRNALIQYPDGRRMRNFYSRKLRRTFPSIVFVRFVDIVPEST